ncbi:MAG: hypothetical protein R2788_04490 [Saprospiraceae bacterium]
MPWPATTTCCTNTKPDYKKFTADKRKRQQLTEQNERSSQETDFLQFQLNEFNEIELVANEQEQLEAELNQLTNAEEIKPTSPPLSTT